MSDEAPPSRPDASGAGRSRRWPAVLWRGVVILIIVVAVVALAKFLRSPGRFEGTGGSDLRPAEVEFPPPSRSPIPGSRKVVSDDPDEPINDLRRLMAGVLMAAAGEQDGEYEDPLNQTPEQRRAFLAERFRLPFDYPRGELPPELLPEEAEVLAVFGHPERNGTRMVLVRMKVDIAQALSAFNRRYVADGWHARPPEASPEQRGPGTHLDRGWLIRFKRGRQDRFVFARPRQSGRETLAAIYEARY